MIDKNLIELLLQDHYICKRSCRDKRYSYALYSGTMELKECISTKQFKRLSGVLKESKNRFTLNLTKVRGQHGKSLFKQLYKKQKCNTQKAA